MIIAIYCSSHGLGHLTRCLEVGEGLVALGHSVTIVTRLENCQMVGECCTETMTMAVGVAGLRVTLRDVVADAGARQRDVFSVDVEETMRAYQYFYENAEDILEREKAWLLDSGVSIVVSDVVPFALRAAEMAGIPSCCLSNFTWDYIYTSFGGDVRERYGEMLMHLEEELYSRASVYLRLPGACPCVPQLDALAIDIPMISRKSKTDGSEVRRRLGLSDSQKVCLVMLGGHRLSGVGSFTVHDIVLPDGWICLMTSSIWRDMQGEDAVSASPAHVRGIHDDAYIPDIIGCSDVVLGKVGFGTVGECLSSETPLVYVKRENFAEEEHLIRLLDTHECGVEVSKEAFVSGDWRFLEDVLKYTNPRKIPSDGARVAAELISRVDLVYRTLRTAPLDDVRNFCFEVVAQVDGDRLFNNVDPIYINRAPGRIDVFGGIADYSWSHALEMPTREGIVVGTQCQTHDEGARQGDVLVRVLSPCQNSGTRPAASAAILLSDIVSWNVHGMLVALNTDDVTHRLKKKPSESWIAYIVGAFVVIAEAKKAMLPKNLSGISILVKSNLPEGAGVSSSAALEVASLASIGAALGVSFEDNDIPLLAQRVENFIVGVSCGLMDQLTCYYGMAGSLLSLRCSDPVQIFGQLKIPDNLRVWGIFSGVRHSTGSSQYTSVRTSAFMGKKIIHQAAKKVGTRMLALTDLTPKEFEENYKHLLPEKISGADFISRYNSHDDPVTHVSPEKSYELRHATSHPIYENERVKQFTDFIQNPKKSSDRVQCELMGALMYESHESYSRCGLGSKETDLLVSIAKRLGASHGIYGAKISGGGCGGTVCILTSNDGKAEAAIQKIQQEYEGESGIQTCLFTGSSGGSRSFGTTALSFQE